MPTHRPTRAQRASAAAVNAYNASTTRRAERVANVLVATLAGCLGAAALVHWATPCEAGTLCAALAAPGSWHRRATRRVTRWVLALQLAWQRTRLCQLQQAALNEATRRTGADALLLAALLAKAAACRTHIARLEQLHRQASAVAA